MKNNMLSRIFSLILFSLLFNTVSAQTSEKVKSEITAALRIWNDAGKNSSVDQILAQFDNTDDIMLVGSDSGEIYKGHEEIKKWLTGLFSFASFSWEMKRVDIDANGNTAWVFMDGKMIVKFIKGGELIRPYRFTGIMIKKEDGWKWRLFDGSIPKGE